MGREQRRLKNWLLSPLIQLKIIGHIILVSFVFLLLTLFYCYWAWGDLLNALVELTDLPTQVRAILNERFSGFFVVLALILLAQFTAMIVFLVIHTHRFVGASFALRRFVRDKLRQKDYSSQVVLRQNDYLFEISEELNQLSNELGGGQKASE